MKQNVNATENAIRKIVTDSILNVNRSLITPISNAIHSPLIFRRGEAIYSGVYDSSYFFTEPYYIHYLKFNSEWVAGGIPVQADFNIGNWPAASQQVFSIRFERTNYLKELKSRLNQKIDPKKLLASVPNPFEEMKSSAERMLRGQLEQINKEYQHTLNDKVRELSDFDKISVQDFSSLRQQYMNADILRTLNEQQNLLNALQTQRNLGEKIDTGQLNAVMNSVNVMEGTKKLIETAEAHQKRWRASGLVSQLKQWDVLKVTKLNEVMNDPSVLTKLARQQLNLNSIQRFFLKVNQMKVGENSLSTSSLGFQNFWNNGALTEFINKGKSAMLFMGKSLEGKSINDLPFLNSQVSNAFAKGLQLGKRNTNGSLNISAMSFDEGLSTVGNIAGLTNFKRSVVTTIGKEFFVGERGRITAEVSRSVSSYNFKSSGGSSVAKLFSPENLATNTSFDIRYRDEFPETGLAYQVHVKRNALGYDNPGSAYMNTGSKEGGFSIRKKFLKKKLAVSLRNELREYSYSEEGTNKWRNLYSVAEVQWRMRKGQFISLRYLPNRMIRIDASGKQQVSVFDQLSLDGSINKKVHNSFYSTYLSVAGQRNQYNYDNSVAGNRAIGLTVNQSFAFKKTVVFWNTQFNRSVNASKLVYFNSNCNSEIGTSLNLFGKISSSTSLSYNTVQQWYQQIGLREVVSLQLRERLNVNLFVDARKNLKLYQPLIFGLVRGEIGIHYTIK